LQNTQSLVKYSKGDACFHLLGEENYAPEYNCFNLEFLEFSNMSCQ